MRCGEWIIIDGENDWVEIQCSKCKELLRTEEDEKPLYCQYCGSRNDEVKLKQEAEENKTE